ncbi:MAG: phosphoadenosine phosphosulfate reductase family protein [Bacilli bacterium]|nr:phosphoadenosine phosphosulfate reductase family protein [Bacilli bacterium]
MKYIASISFGKDSLAMLLRLIEENKPLDEVVFYDTGMEFECIYKLRDKILPILKEHKIKYTELRPKEPFFYTMFYKPVKKKDGSSANGYSWCGGRCRWGTTEKLKALEKYSKGNYEYVGIAYDEPQRLNKERKGNKLFPLAEWEMTEKDCLKYCYDKGFNWNENGIELYSILDRVSCWCCANKNLKELKNYYKYLPFYWGKLKELQSKTSRPMKYNKYTVFDLEERFKNEK